MVSAYQNTDGTPVVVVINYQNEERAFEINWKTEAFFAWKPYLTSDAPEARLTLQPTIASGEKLVIPARSVLTYVGVLKI
jgi:hypothetical protein